MGASPAQPSQREAIKALVLDELGAKRVAEWCGVSVGAVWQWVSRASREVYSDPIPVRHAATIVRQARAEGLKVDLSPLTVLLGLEPAP